MPGGDGWSEPWPRRELDELGVWEQFVQQVDTTALHHELYGTGGRRLDDERPGSAVDLALRAEHERRRAALPEPDPPYVMTVGDPLVAATMDAYGWTREQATARVVAARRENQDHHHTRGTAA